MSGDNTQRWTQWHTTGLLLVLISILFFGWEMDNQSIGPKTVVENCTKYYQDSYEQLKTSVNSSQSEVVNQRKQKAAKECKDLSAPWAWSATLFLMLVFTIIAGHGVTGRWSGFLIDPRNKMTLARLQLVGWTILILGTYFVLVLARLFLHDSVPSTALSINVPNEVWALLGISLTSVGGSALILSEKKNKDPDTGERDLTLNALAKMNSIARASAEKENIGTVVVHDDPKKARAADMFRGDETGNAAHLDMSKVQMFFFTVILIVVYYVTLSKSFVPLILMSNPSFPAIDSSMVSLLGISHLGYLGHKAIPHSKPA